MKLIKIYSLIILRIWTNLELYFESYDFYNFKEFFWIYLELFSIFLKYLNQ